MSTTSSRQRANFAAAVSRRLVNAGIRTLPSGTPRTREGIRVTSGWTADACGVAVDIDLPRKAARIAADITEVLTGLGYTVTPNPHDPLLLTVEQVQA